MRKIFLNIVVIALSLGQVFAADRPKVQSIDFIGNEHFSDRKLKSLMGIKECRLLKKNYLYRDLLIKDLKEVVDFYYLNGFTSAQIQDFKIDWSPDSAFVDIRVIVNEGAQVRINSIVIEGIEDSIVTEKIIGKIIVKPGSKLNFDSIRQSTYNVTRFMGDEGYLFANITRTLEQDGDTADLHYTIKPGPRYKLGRVKISGNELTKNWLIRRELKIKNGESVNLKEIDACRERLYRTGLFDKVALGTEQAEADSIVDIVVTVSEKEPGEFSCGAGYGSEDRGRLDAQISYINYDGRAAAWEISGKISPRIRSVVLKHFTPYLIRSGMYFNGILDYSFKNEYIFLSEKWEGTCGLGRSLSDNWKVDGFYSFKKTTLFEIPADIAQYYSGAVINQFGIETLYDSRDNKFFSRNGNYMLTSLSVSNPSYFENPEFIRSSIDIRSYGALGDKLITAIQARGGGLFRVGVNSIPLEERFFLGGYYSVRGYPRNSLGQTTPLGNPLGGDFFSCLRGELRIEIHSPVYIKAFWDSGWISRNVQDAELEDVYSGAGVGIGAVFGVWVGRVEYGWQVDDGFRPGEWYFQVGQAF